MEYGAKVLHFSLHKTILLGDGKLGDKKGRITE